MKKKYIFTGLVSLICIVVPTMRATAQNNNEKKETISLPEMSTQLPEDVPNPQLMPASATTFPPISTELFGSHPLLSPYTNRLRFNQTASILWAPTSKFSIKTSAFISEQFGYVLPSRQVVYGTGLMLNYAITDRLLFRVWGQYVTPGNNDPFLNANPLFPKTNVGMDLHYKATEKTEIGVGVEYQYNQKTNTWKPESVGKVKIGF